MPVKFTTSANGRSKRRRKDSSSDADADTTIASNVSSNMSTTRTAVNYQLQQTMNTTRAVPQGRKILSLVGPVIEEIQRPRTSMEEALRTMEKLYEENDKKDFPEVLWRVMVIPFHFTKGNDKTDRIVKFFYRVITTIGNDYESLGNNVMPFRILRLCVKYHREKRVAVRYRVVETINTVLQSLADKNVLPKEIKESIVEVLMERLKDKHHSVRAQSAAALGFLQFSPECKRINQKMSTSLIYAVVSDPNAEVRKAALKSLQIDKTTLEYLVQKVRDKNDAVRTTALSLISEKVPIRTFTISQRECILQSSLKNVPVAVKKQGLVVLQKWQESCQGDLCELLEKLDVIDNEKLCYLILHRLFPEANAENFERIDKSFLVGKLIPLENLTTERTFLWLFLFQKFISDPYYKDKLMPPASDLFAYVKRYLQQDITEDSDTAKEKSHFMLRHILHIFKFLQLEEGSRGQMKEIIATIFQSHYLSVVHINILVELLHICFLDDKEEGVMNIVNSVLESSVTVVSAEAEATPVFDEDKLMLLKLELANAMHGRHRRKREQDDAVLQNNFILAQECQVEIEELTKREEEVKILLAKYNKPLKTLEENSEDEEEAPVVYPSIDLCIAFTTIITHVRITQNISPQVRHFYERRVANEMHTFEDPKVRQLGLKLITLVGLHNFEDAEKAMAFCIEGLTKDQPSVQVEALKCIFDLILEYSFEEFEALPEVVQLIPNGHSAELDAEKISPLRMLSLQNLQSTDTALLNTTVEGVIKLLLSNKLHSPNAVSTLLLVWANPANCQTKIYKDVQRWLPIYANTGFTQANLIANAFVPCLQKILTAKRTSPLSDASIECFSAFVLQSTEQKSILKQWAHKIHVRIALTVLEELREHICTPHSIIFARVLKQVDVQNCEPAFLREMMKISKYMLSDTNRQVRCIITDFLQYLQSLGGTLEDTDDDLEIQATLRPGSQSLIAAANNSEDSINVNEVFSSSDSEDEENQNEILITRSPTIERLSQESARSKSLRLRMLSSLQPVLSPIISDGDGESSDSSTGSIYGPTPPF